MSSVSSLPLIVALIGQAPANADFAAESEARLAYMKKSVLVYDIRPVDDPQFAYKLQPEPVLRFTNPVGRVRDGTVFLWLDGDGRPVVVAQATLNLKGPGCTSSPRSCPAGTCGIEPGTHMDHEDGRSRVRPIPARPATRPDRQRAADAECALTGSSPSTRCSREVVEAAATAPQALHTLRPGGLDVVDGALFCFSPHDRPRGLSDARGAGRKGNSPVWQYASPVVVFPIESLVEGQAYLGAQYRTAPRGADLYPQAVALQ